MGYRVVCYPDNAPSGNLGQGRIVRTEGTYYHHPGAASKAAHNWVQRNPKSFAQIQRWDSGEVIETRIFVISDSLCRDGYWDDVQ